MGRHRKYDSELNRLNLYIPADIKEYLVTASAKASIENNRNISLTEYIVMLVKADRSKSSEVNVKIPKDKKIIPVLKSPLSAAKKGLRIEVNQVIVDNNNVSQELHIEYSGFHERGGAIIEVAQRNKVDLPKV